MDSVRKYPILEALRGVFQHASGTPSLKNRSPKVPFWKRSTKASTVLSADIKTADGLTLTPRNQPNELPGQTPVMKGSAVEKQPVVIKQTVITKAASSLAEMAQELKTRAEGFGAPTKSEHALQPALEPRDIQASWPAYWEDIRYLKGIIQTINERDVPKTINERDVPHLQLQSYQWYRKNLILPSLENINSALNEVEQALVYQGSIAEFQSFCLVAHWKCQQVKKKYSRDFLEPLSTSYKIVLLCHSKISRLLGAVESMQRKIAGLDEHCRSIQDQLKHLECRAVGADSNSRVSPKKALETQFGAEREHILTEMSNYLCRLYNANRWCFFQKEVRNPDEIPKPSALDRKMARLSLLLPDQLRRIPCLSAWYLRYQIQEKRQQLISCREKGPEHHSQLLDLIKDFVTRSRVKIEWPRSFEDLKLKAMRCAQEWERASDEVPSEPAVMREELLGLIKQQEDYARRLEQYQRKLSALDKLLMKSLQAGRVSEELSAFLEVEEVEKEHVCGKGNPRLPPELTKGQEVVEPILIPTGAPQ